MKKNNARKIYLLLTFCIMSATSLLAVPAKPTPIVITQPDGSKLTVMLRGDEFFHFYTTTDGYLIQKDESGYFRYSAVDANKNLIISTVKVNNFSDRFDNEKQFLSSIKNDEVYSALETKAKSVKSRFKVKTETPIQKLGNFPTTGQVKSLVILVQYQDKQFTVSNPNTSFHDLLNKEGYSYNGASGSVKDYFVENSGEKFQPQFDVYGPVTLSHNMSYYGGNDSWGNDQAPEQMVIEACNQLNATVDFSQYDSDNDGWIDNIYIYYAGLGEADGGSDDTVWPHAWNIYTGAGQTLMVDGKQVGSYSCSNEIDGTVMTGIGTFTHEFMHVLGLPDLYATSYTSAFTPGEWSILDYGPYNNQGRTPPYMSVFERYSLGWVVPVELSSPASVLLKNIANNEGFIIKTSKSNEYFLFENRQQLSWDKYIPGHGMLVWHIDYNQSIWDGNTVNNTASHQYVDIEEADGTQSESSRAGDAFPGTSGKTQFTDATTPNMKTWAGVALNKPITEIKESNEVITFNFMGGKPFVGAPVAKPATDITQTGFTANWEQFDGVTHYELDAYELDETNKKVYVPGYQSIKTGNVLSYIITGINPETKYYYVVRGANQYAASENSNEISVTTLDRTFDFFSPVALPATTVISNGFTANWETLTDASGYFIDVYKMKIGAPDKFENVNFNNKLSDLPSGWKSTSSSFYASAGYFGVASPALRFDANKLYIQSKVYDEDIRIVKFWYRGSNASAENSLTVSGYDGSVWKDIQVTKPLKNEVGGETVTIEASNLVGIKSVKFTYNKVSTGNLTLDDISVGYGGALVIDPVAAYVNKSVDNVISFDVSELEPETEYYYTISATNGTLFSKKSNEIKVITAKDESTGLNTVNSNYKVVITNSEIIINTTSGNDDLVQIYNYAGQLIISRTIRQQVRISKSELTTGIYILKAGNITQKIII